MNVPAERMLVEAVAERVDDQLDRLIHLSGLIPHDWALKVPQLPAETFPDARSIGRQLGHLMESLDGFCGTLYNADADRFRILLEAKRDPHIETYTPADALVKFGSYRTALSAAFAALVDADLRALVRSPFRAEGETLLARLLINLEHVVNHKHGLFLSLKLLGVTLGTADLYRFE